MKAQSKRVALVAQSADDASATVALLKQIGWEAEVVGTWNEAGGRVRSSRSSVLITDYDLAGGNGYDLIVDWRQRELYLHVLFVASEPVKSCVPMEKMGCCAVLMKPFSAEDLATALKKLLRERWTARGKKS